MPNYELVSSTHTHTVRGKERVIQITFQGGPPKFPITQSRLRLFLTKLTALAMVDLTASGPILRWLSSREDLLSTGT